MPASIGITFAEDDMHKWYGVGANFIFCGDDTTMLVSHVGNTLTSMRQRMSGKAD
jgi:2-keto-3-deoxy-L-rhamnonate aldolase RhmA